MKMTLLISFLFCITGQRVSAQTPYDTSRIRKLHAINLLQSNVRGIESEEGIVYYIESNLHDLSAYRGGKILWKVNIIEQCGIATVGKREIRFLELKGNKLYVTYGKHSSAEVRTGDGKTICTGSD
jgi:hypothetical protein